MTDNEQHAGDVFAGAGRAARYVEPEHTSTRAQVDEALRQASGEDELIQVPAEFAAPRPAHAEPVEELPPIPAAPPSAPATEIPETIFLDPVADLSVASTIQKQPVATQGVRGMLSKLGIKVEPGARERAMLDAAEALRRDEEVIRQATWPGPRAILVGNKKGGTGKTPVALIVGGVLAAVRGGSVAIMEVSDDPGALTFRAEGNPSLGIGELVRDVERITNAGQLAGYTAPQTSFASVIGTVGRRPRLTREDVVAAAGVIDEFYSIRVMDSGNQPSSSAFEGAVETADALVVPVLNAGDAVLEAVAMVEELRASGERGAQLADNAIVIRLTDGRPEHPQVIERVNRIIDGMHVREVYHVPYDEHIAERGQITLSRLSPATRAAFTAATAGVVKALKSTAR